MKSRWHWKIERNLSKDQILDSLHEPDLSGTARLRLCLGGTNLFWQAAARHHHRGSGDAGRPAAKAPSANNPVVNPKRAKVRQQYILLRMRQLGYITEAQYEQAKNETLHIKTGASEFGIHDEYVTEMARQLVYEQFKDDTYSRAA